MSRAWSVAAMVVRLSAESARLLGCRAGGKFCILMRRVLLHRNCVWIAVNLHYRTELHSICIGFAWEIWLPGGGIGDMNYPIPRRK